MSPRKDEEFGALDVPKMSLKDKSEKRYLVYRDASDFVEVEANTAQEAISASQVKNPYKVLRIVKDLGKVLDQSMLEKIENGTVETEEVVAPEAAASETAAPEAPAQEDQDQPAE